MEGSFKNAFELLEKTGVVIPVFFHEGTEPSDTLSGRLLGDTVDMFCSQMAEKKNICLSVDGIKNGASFVKEIAEKYGISFAVSEKNKGKFGAVANGVKRLLEINPGLKYIAEADQDGDHFANELVNFVRAAEHIRESTKREHVLVIGRRFSRHRPMGFPRGELEELADRILLDALFFNSARKDEPLSIEFTAMFGEFPDFHSGYKLFSAEVAKKVFLGKHRLAGVSEDCFYRHACEAAMVLEALENGAVMGEVLRSTINEQPVSVFGTLKRETLVADKIIWPCKRLDIPKEFVLQWMGNHIPRLQYSTLYEGKKELEEIYSLVAEAFDSSSRPGRVNQPMFL